MRGRLQLFIGIFMVLSLLVMVTTANALTEKELWEKQYGDAYRLRPLDPPVILEHGGPDAGGYYYIDSDDPALNKPVYNWIDISGIGTNMGISSDDQNVGPFPIGFTFNFYGADFTSFNACSNGWASFTSTSTDYSNDPIPSSSEPNNLLAVFWDDLHPRSGQAFYYTNNVDTCIIAWHNFERFSGDGNYTFEIILTADNHVVYQYQSMTGILDSHTIGIENGDGSIGSQYRYNQPGLVDGTAVYFGLEGPIFGEHEVYPAAFVDLPAFGQVGDAVTPTVTFRNQGSSTESFPVRLIVNLNDTEVYNETGQINNLEPNSTADFAFPAFTSTQEGVHEFVAISELSGDENPANDTLREDYTAFGQIYYEDFEVNNGFFEGDGDWQWGAPTSGPGAAHHGTNLWATNLGGNYSTSMLAHLLTPVFGLSDNASLGFWLWYDTEANFDGFNVKISTDDGVSWTIITPDGGYDGVGNTANPLSGEEIFTGHGHNFWQFKTFDLSTYAGSAVYFRVDFGSDGSVQYPGPYIDEWTIFGGGGAEPGYIAGTVTDLATSDPIQGAVVNAGNGIDTTDASGNYIVEVIPGTYSVTASAMYYNSMTVDGVEVIEGDTTDLDFALTAPVIQVDTSPIQTALLVGDTIVFTRNVANTGNGQLQFSISLSIGGGIVNASPIVRPAENGISISRNGDFPLGNTAEYSPAFTPGHLPTILDFGDEVFRYDPETQSGDIRILGIEFDGTNFWLTGGNDLVTHYLHKFDHDGNYVQSFNQGTTSQWGWRDLAWDGEYLYGSDEDELAIIDPATGLKIGELPMPNAFSPPLRALAYDPATDHFWSANWATVIIEFDRSGTVVNSYANALNIYGMAWDDVSEGGPFLWTYSQDGTPGTLISQFDPSTGQYTGVSFYAIDNNGNDALAGGICFTTEWDPSIGVLGAILQDSPDNAVGYEVTPASQWLIVDPMSGVLEPSENMDLSIMIDFRGDDIVPDSTYEASIVVHNNTPETPEIPVSVDAVTGIDDNDPNLPREVALYQNFPNPFNPSTDIKFALPEQSDVTIEVFNILGQKTAIIAQGLFPAGYHSVSWNAGNTASGVYYYKLTAGDKTMVKKMMLLK